MRLGLIADIHGNAAALDTVLDALAREGIDQFVCLGDVAVLGPEPRRVIDRLRAIGCPCVRGNTDAWLLDEPSDAEAPSPGPAAGILTWCQETLDPDDVAFLAGLPQHLSISLGSRKTLLCAHGSPRSFEDVIGPSTPAADVDAMFAGHDATFAAGGHTHVQLFRRFPGMGFINPGSAGLPGVGPGTPDLPVNRDVSWAEFAIFTDDARTTSIELRRVPLDLDRTFGIAQESGMPHFDWWRSRWAPG